MLAGEALWQVAKEVCHQQCQSPLKELELNQCRLEKTQDRISLSSCFSEEEMYIQVPLGVLRLDQCDD